MGVPNASETATWTDALRGIVGAAHVRPATAADDVLGVRPQAVIEPADEQQVASVLRAANDLGLAVVPSGGGTKLSWGNPPSRADIVLSTARLNQILDHPWADLTVTVEAGCTIAALQAALRPHGQHVAIDVLWPERATVGGVLSANDSGALRLRFGALRDLIIGATLALPDGTLAASGGKVVKNVAGYDLSKLATGALGTLGIITRAVFRLHPLPQGTQTWSCAPETLGAAQQVISAIQDSRLAHTSLQLRAASTGALAVDLRFEGSEAGMAGQSAQLAGAPGLKPRGSTCVWSPGPSGPGSSQIWTARESLWRSAGAVVKISVLSTDIAAALAALGDASGHSRWQAVVFATGLGWIQIDDSDRTAGVIQAVRHFAESRGGSAVVLRPSPRCAGVEAWGRVGDAHPLMLAIKQQFDPRRTLNPGRFAGAI